MAGQTFPRLSNATVEQRFWQKVSRQTPDQCWPWMASGVPAGYGGMAGADGKREYAHRISWKLANGEIPPGLFVLHRCDNPKCVNPDHLFLGTHRDNMANMTSKGRGARGSRVVTAKLTEDKVRAIRRATGKLHRDIAAEYGVTRALVSIIRARRLWRHVTD